MACTNREIITLQIGHYSNFIGAHWWNIQQSSFVYNDPSVHSDLIDVNHDLLFREGRLTCGQATYTPRLLIIDAKGSLGSLPRGGLLYDSSPSASAANSMWDDGVDIINQLPEIKNDYLTALEEEDNLLHSIKDEDKDICDATNERRFHLPVAERDFNISKDVNVWTDYLRPHLHPDSVYILKDARLQEAKEDVASWGFQNGASVMKNEEVYDEITNRIRKLAESCESLQGFQLLGDSHSGMGGISSIIGQYIADEYKPKDLFSFVSTPPHLSSLAMPDISMLLASITQCYVELSKVSSILTPLNLRRHSWHTWADPVTFPQLEVDMDNAYESSAILASFLDTVSIPYRKQSKPYSMAHLSQLLTPYGRMVVSGSVSLPVGGVRPEPSSFTDWVRETNSLDPTFLTGGCRSQDYISEAVVIRGLPNDVVKREHQQPSICTSWDQYESFMREMGQLPRHYIYTGTSNKMKTAVPFPRIFKKENPSSVSTAAGLHQGKGIQRFLEVLLQDAAKLDVSRVPKLMKEDVDRDVWREVLEDFRTLVGNYGGNKLSTDLGGDDDDDY